MELKNLSIDQLGLSTRASNMLHRCGCHTMGEMLKFSEEELWQIRGIGAKTVAEIKDKIETCKRMLATEASSESGEQEIRISEKLVPLEAMDTLSVRAYNKLKVNGIRFVSDLLPLKYPELMKIPGMDYDLAEEIRRSCRTWKDTNKEYCLHGSFESSAAPEEANARAVWTDADLKPVLADEIRFPENRDAVFAYVKTDECSLEEFGLSARPLNCLHRASCFDLSDIIFMTEEDLLAIHNMGRNSVSEVLRMRDTWIEQHAQELRAAINGTAPVFEPKPADDETVRCLILQLYILTPYAGLSLQDLTEQLPPLLPTEQIKRCVGALLAARELEYVDFRCYRVYPAFARAIELCPGLNENKREIMRRRIQGETLESVGAEFQLTRERVRQITGKQVNVIRKWLLDQKQELFMKANALRRSQFRMPELEKPDEMDQALVEEDYYLYFYQTYRIEKKDAIDWLGFTPAALTYLSLLGRGGSAALEDAQEDRRLGSALRQRIRNFLNRNKLWLGGQWIPKNRQVLEKYVIERFCREDTTFDVFVERYNAFLREQDIPFSDKLYITDAVKRTRLNHLSDERYLLWKQGETLRFYDVDGRDYTELFEALGLDELENIELSTQKFVNDFPDVLSKYDIRDRYELHNLLRKVLPDGSFHDFKIGRMPNICFGEFDRDTALFELMVSHAPILQKDLADLIYEEYGYDQGVTNGTYLAPLSDFFHQGWYTITEKTMLYQNRQALLAALDGDFFFMDELRRIYARAVPGADLEELNSYNLKQLGFTIRSNYVYRNYSSVDEYFRTILTEQDILDISQIRKRYAYVQQFSMTLYDLKRRVEVVEFEPNRLIHARRLRAAGITREDIEEFCDRVYDFVEDGAFFSAKSIREAGFASELYDLGFSDWFYANLLLTDPRFSWGYAYKTIILYKGRTDVSIRAFEERLIRDAGSIDVYDLQSELEETYGCVISDRLDLIYKAGSRVYYDKTLDRLYDSEERFWREFDEAGEG